MDPGGIPFDAAYVIARDRVDESCDPLPNLVTTLGEASPGRRLLLVARPAANDPAAVLQLRRNNRPRQIECSRIVRHRFEECRAQVDVAAACPVHPEAHGATSAQGRDAYAPAHTCIQRLHGDLRPAQNDHRIDRLERDALAPLG